MRVVIGVSHAHSQIGPLLGDGLPGGSSVSAAKHHAPSLLEHPQQARAARPGEWYDDSQSEPLDGAFTTSVTATGTRCSPPQEPQGGQQVAPWLVINHAAGDKKVERS